MKVKELIKELPKALVKPNTRKDLIRIIKARKKNNYKSLFLEANKMLSSCWSILDKHKEYKMISELADFNDCATTNECDHLLKNQQGDI